MRWGPVKLRNGAVIQAGIGAQDRGQQSLDPKRRPFRALVIHSRVVGVAGQVRNLGVEVDVLLVRTNVMVHNVTVAQRSHGINNVSDLWVPRPTTRTLDGSTLNLAREFSARGTPSGPSTSLDNVDGDMVLLDFIEGDINWPIVTHALTHERTNRIIRTGLGTGWREGSTAERGSPRAGEHYTHHQGCEVRINEQGDLLVDTAAAYSDGATEDPTALSGQVRFRVKDTQRFTVAIGDDEDVLEVWKEGGQVRIDLGEGATERLVLGDSFMQYLNNFIVTEYGVHTHATGTGPSGAPIVPATQMSDALLSDLAKSKKV